MRLKKKQREQLIAWTSEGLKTDEINERARGFAPPFEVSTQQVDWYRDRHHVKLKEIQASGEYDALTTGLALKEARIRRLQELAELLEEDLFGDRLWLDRVKAAGFMRVDYEEFNATEVQQYRGLLDDIAKEVGHRKQSIEHSGQVDVRALSDDQLRAIIEG
jgi:hypothetical protein